MQEPATPRAYQYFNQVEVRFVDAAVARLIPSDDLGPGAKEADVTYYIDRHLCSVWGAHGRNYRSGPWRQGTPEQGFQSRLTPQEIYRAGIRETNQYCRERYDNKLFDFLSAEQQDEVLKALERDEVALASLSSKLFFEILWRNTEEGFFSDPIYGGNRDKVGWKLLGFPGIASSEYNGHLDNPEPFHAEPVSILDILQQKVSVNAQGFPKHVRSKDKTR